jgi:uncharacterized phage infection (PIP) family protein YhgE
MFGWRRRLERKVDLILERLPRIMSALEDVIAQIDSATTAIATALDNEGKGISAVASEVAALHAQLSAAPTVTPAVLSQLSSINSRLSSAQATIAAQATQLQSIGADPANPVPTPAPAAPAPAPTTPGT